MNDEFVDVVENVELLLFEIKALRAGHAGFRITHRFHNPGSDCAPGEEAAAVHFMYRGREFYVRLTGILLLLFEYLARHSHLPQTAPQIVAGMRADPFFQRHGANVTSRVPQARKISRSCIKVYVERLRIALGQTFRDAHVPLDPYAVLVSEETTSNHVGYRLKATIRWIHVDHPGRTLIGP